MHRAGIEHEFFLVVYQEVAYMNLLPHTYSECSGPLVQDTEKRDNIQERLKEREREKRPERDTDSVLSQDSTNTRSGG